MRSQFLSKKKTTYRSEEHHSSRKFSLGSSCSTRDQRRHHQGFGSTEKRAGVYGTVYTWQERKVPRLRHVTAVLRGWKVSATFWGGEGVHFRMLLTHSMPLPTSPCSEGAPAMRGLNIETIHGDSSQRRP